MLTCITIGFIVHNRASIVTKWLILSQCLIFAKCLVSVPTNTLCHPNIINNFQAFFRLQLTFSEQRILQHLSSKSQSSWSWSADVTQIINMESIFYLHDLQLMSLQTDIIMLFLALFQRIQKLDSRQASLCDHLKLKWAASSVQTTSQGEHEYFSQ